MEIKGWLLIFVFSTMIESCFTRTTTSAPVSKRSFSIDYKQDCFMKDGEPFRYISGSLHYFRVPPFYWKDRLVKAKALGLNTIQTYIPWNFHEVRENSYRFNGDRDLLKFIQMVSDEGLFLILRPGPYIDAEWDFGGLPWWLADKECKIRTSDPTFMFYVKRWFDFMFPMLQPKLYKNGGPIISFQIENEYGNYFSCDKEYLSMLKSIYVNHFGEDVVLFTTDGYKDDHMQCGTNPNQIFATIDFGTEIAPKDAFTQQRKYQSHGPLVNSEFYTGWLDYWGGVHQRRGAEEVADQLATILTLNASVNLYMLHGGTNFGFMNGADIDENGSRQISPTSYDYDAPISESGDTTWKYFKLREIIQEFVKKPLPPVPVNTTKLTQGFAYIVPLQSLVGFKSYLVEWGLKVIKSTSPKRMSELGLGYGFVIYSPNVTSASYQNKTVTLVFEDLSDQAILVVDDVYTLSIDEPVKNYEVQVKLGVTLDIVIVNQGRAASAPKGVHYLPECKGICGRVWHKETNRTITDWEQYNVNDTTIWEQITDKRLREDHYIRFLDKTSSSSRETSSTSRESSIIIKDQHQQYLKETVKYQFVWESFFVLQNVTDCYLRMKDFNKGQVYLNRHNLGRFWQSKGPQKTLFVPKDFLLVGVNNLLVVALDDYPSKIQQRNNPQFEFVDSPDLG